MKQYQKIGSHINIPLPSSNWKWVLYLKCINLSCINTKTVTWSMRSNKFFVFRSRSGLSLAKLLTNLIRIYHSFIFQLHPPVVELCVRNQTAPFANLCGFSNGNRGTTRIPDPTQTHIVFHFMNDRIYWFRCVARNAKQPRFYLI